MLLHSAPGGRPLHGIRVRIGPAGTTRVAGWLGGKPELAGWLGRVPAEWVAVGGEGEHDVDWTAIDPAPVSYTHLTLPTILLV